MSPIIGIMDGHEYASSAFEGGISCGVRTTVVGLRNDGDSIVIGGERCCYRNSGIGTCVIDDNDLQLPVGLGKQRAERSSDRFGRIEGRHDHGDERTVGPVDQGRSVDTQVQRVRHWFRRNNWCRIAGTEYVVEQFQPGLV
jgi:hypothetical protein